MFFRQRPLQKQIANQYKDLLNAIKNQNFESLEHLCEPNLTTELAAKIYEHTAFHGIQMRIVGQKEEIEVDIINHFYVTGMDIDRKLNANLQDYRMVERGNTL
jgi:hypothetical protein